MTDATIVATKNVCLKAAFENAMEIEFSTTGDYTLPKDAHVAGFIPGKCGGTAVVKTTRSVSSGVVTAAVLTLTVGKASTTNSVYVLLE